MTLLVRQPKPNMWTVDVDGANVGGNYSVTCFQRHPYFEASPAAAFLAFYAESCHRSAERARGQLDDLRRERDELKAACRRHKAALRKMRGAK